MKFEKIIIPPGWKDSFTKYPNGRTIFEALSQTITTVNEGIEEVNERVNQGLLAIDQAETTIRNEITESFNILKLQLEGEVDELSNDLIADFALLQSEVLTLIAGKVNAADVYTKQQVDAQLAQMSRVNVMSNNFNVVGDGVVDDTVAINSVFTYAKTNGVNTIYFPAGTYLIDGKASDFYWKHDGGIQIDFPCNVILHSDAIIKQKPTAEQGYNIFRIFDTHGVMIKGGKLEGDRTVHLDTTGEFGFGIFIIGSDNITIEDVEIVDMWGDGIIQDANVSHKLDCDNIKIKNCKINNNRRNNITLCSGNHIIIENNVISNANGIAPKAGIVIEDSARLGLSVNDIVISKNRFYGNVTSDIVIADTVTKICIQDNIFETNGNAINVSEESPKLEYANFNNNVIDCTSRGLICIYLKASTMNKINIVGNKIKYFTNPSGGTIVISRPAHNAVISNNEITNCLYGLNIRDSNDFVIESNVFKNLTRALFVYATEGQYVSGLIANNVFKTLTTGIVFNNIYNSNIVGNIFDAFGEAIIMQDLEKSNISNNFFKGNASSIAISSTYSYKSVKNSFLNNRFECDDTTMTAISILNSASINNVSSGNVARYKTKPFDIVAGNIAGVNFTQ